MRTDPRYPLGRLRGLLSALQLHVRDALLRARDRQARDFARVVAHTTADTIYFVDRLGEEAILQWFDGHWPRELPVQLVMEGVEDDVEMTIPRATPIAKTVFKCIIDPIDGTRGLMYDKRSGWMLAALAPQRGADTHLGDVTVAAMTELPTSKQGRADQFSAVRGEGVVAERMDLGSKRRTRLCVTPSTARDFRHGFACFARFFPAGKVIISQIEEAVWLKLHGRSDAAPVVFDDQYISTGGQLAELLVGHDRMIVDVRPLVFAALKLSSALVCHPYDICTELILREAGGIVETPDGKPLRAPLDTTTPISWVGYANPVLARLARPALRHALKRMLCR